jgi:uncharacterized protein
MAVTTDRLKQVERAESALRALGISGNLRVRHHGDLARIEIDRALVDQWRAGAAFDSLSDAMRLAGFDKVELDPRGFRSGSLNVLAGASLPGD